MYTEHSILLGDIDPKDLKNIAKLIERNEDEFEEYVLSRYSADEARYDYCTGSLKVTDIEHDIFSFTASVSYYAGCSDLNTTDEVEGEVPYEIIDGEIKFSLPEFVWDVR